MGKRELSHGGVRGSGVPTALHSQGRAVLVRISYLW